ncbi:GGDEF domain-containing protein [Paraglaciecola sp.]|uniref:GGDEF domain-containing protein n=1 Tax=Paraglaciecola sp. TaxID=1920173 RepID=UPI003EF94A25
MKRLTLSNDNIFNGFLLVVIMSISGLWAFEEYLGIAATQDRIGNFISLIILPICFYFSFIKNKIKLIKVFVYFYLATYLIFLTTAAFYQAAQTGEMYSTASSLQWVPIVYIIAFLFLPQRQAIFTVLGFYALIILLLIISYTDIFPGISDEIHAVFINAVFAQGVCILCLFGVIRLKQTKNETAKYAKKMEKAANIDGLLGIGNRRMLQSELEHLESDSEPFSLLLIDLDNFKHINDTYGHLVGDDVLRAVTSCLEKNLRPQDTIGRWGGEEFLLIAQGAKIEQASQLAERIRKAVAATNILTVGHITISIGVAQFKLNMPISQTFSEADKALYQAKETGRNKVVSSSA